MITTVIGGGDSRRWLCIVKEGNCTSIVESSEKELLLVPLGDINGDICWPGVIASRVLCAQDYCEDLFLSAKKVR